MAVIDRFARHRCRCPGIRREKGVSEKYVRRVRRFVEFLGERGIVQRKPKRAVADARPACGRVPGLAAAASRHHRADDRSTRSHGHAAAPGARHQAAKLECPAHSRRDHCRDEAGLARLCEDDDDGAQRISAVPRRAGVCAERDSIRPCRPFRSGGCRRCRATSASSDVERVDCDVRSDDADWRS